MWQDPWFEQLQTLDKLSFIYLWSNDHIKQSGVLQITPKRFKFDTGLEMNGSVERLSPKVEWFKESDMIWVKNFFRHQCQNSKFAKAALDSLRQYDVMLKLFIEYNKEFMSKFQELDLSIYE
jgi:hypothetical protein